MIHEAVAVLMELCAAGRDFARTCPASDPIGASRKRAAGRQAGHPSGSPSADIGRETHDLRLFNRVGVLWR